MTCKYCTPDRHGKRKALAINEYPLSSEHLGYNRFKRETLKIYRKRNNKRKYFIGLHTIDVMECGTMLRNNGFKFGKEINFCPICDLR